MYLIDTSWTPLIISLLSFNGMIMILLWFKYGLSQGLLMALTVLASFFFWFRDLERESSFKGLHTWAIQNSLKWGLFWFIFSEVWFFFSIFWSFFHVSVSPLSSGNWDWPMEGLFIIPPFQVPLLNTTILLMSGVTATLAHQELLAGKASVWVLMSIFLGFYFLVLQGFEYSGSLYSIASGVYGSIFFFGTGFHGMHVCLGALMLSVSNFRMMKGLISSQHHFGLEFSLWYWHFVDVVWLFLFFWVYMWGS